MKEKRCVVPARPLDIPHTRPAQASLTLRPAGLLSRLKRPLSRGSSPAGYPAEPLVSYQINRQLSGWNLPPLVIRAFGAHCQQRTFVSSCMSDPAAHARPDEAAPGTPIADDLLLASSCQRQRTSQNLVFKPRRSHAPNRSLLRSNRLG